MDYYIIFKVLLLAVQDCKQESSFPGASDYYAAWLAYYWLLLLSIFYSSLESIIMYLQPKNTASKT